MKSLLGKHLVEYMRLENERRALKRQALGALVDEDVTLAEFSTYRMAKDSGINEMTLRRIMENKQYKPGDEVLEALANYLGEDIHKLFDLKRGIEPEDRQRALDESRQVDALGDPHRALFDQALQQLIGAGQGEGNPKGAEIALYILHELQKLREDIALLRRQLQE